MAQLGQGETGIAEIRELARRQEFSLVEAECRRLIERHPEEADAWYFLAVAEGAKGNLQGAEEALRQAVGFDAGNAEYWHSLSMTLLAGGRHVEAEACSRRAVEIDSSNAHYRCGLGNACYGQKRWEEAAADYRQALAIDPELAAAWTNLGAIEHNRKNLAAAELAYENSLRLAPDNLDTLINYGYLLCDRGKGRAALDLVPLIQMREAQGADGWVIQGKAFGVLDDLPAAEAAYREALMRQPGQRVAMHNLGVVLMSQNKWTDAEEVVNRYLQLAPESGDAHVLKASLLQFSAEAEGAVAAARRALDLQPSAERHRKLLTYLHYSDRVDAEALRVEHEAWDALYGKTARAVAARAIDSRKSGGPLRVGLVSGDFKSHPTAHLALAALELVDRSECELFCYSDVVKEDTFTGRFRKGATLWRNAFGTTDEELAEQVRVDRVDILLDLMGHFGKRLGVFARRPAPLQGSWLGYVGTTGLAAIDFLLADRFHVQAGEEKFYTERVVRLGDDYICFSPPDYCPAVSELPALANGYVTFGCFNSPAKYSARILEAWGEILRRVKSAKLLLKYFGFHDAAARKNIVLQLTEQGIAAERIQFEGNSDHAAHLHAYNRIDVALDTQPYSGGLTTCEALWMGVPVITCPGNRFAGRHSTSHLMNSGNGRFVGLDLAAYVELAVEWACRIEELARIRRELREQVRCSPLCDASRFAANLGKALREASEGI